MISSLSAGGKRHLSTVKKTMVLTFAFSFFLVALLEGCAFLSAVKPPSSTTAAEPYSRDAGYYYSLAVLKRLDGDLGGAVDDMKRAMAAQPESSYLTTELVSMYVENGNIDLALALGEWALKKDPGNIDLHSIMGGVYFSRREYDKAIREYQVITEIDPKSAVSYLYLATIYAQEKRYDEAEKAYKKMLQIDPDNIIGLYYYAKTLTQINRQAEAENIYRKIIAQRPLFESAWQELAALLESQKKYTEAIGVYRRYLEANPARITYRVKIAELLIRDGKQDEALAEFQDVLNVEPENAEVRAALGLLYYDLKRYSEAAAEFSRILDMKPGDDRIRYLLANTLEQKGDLSAAKIEYAKVSPSFELFANAQIHTAMILKKEGSLREAAAVINRAIEKKNDDVILYLYLSSLYEDLKDPATAEKILLDGLKQFPRNADLYYVLGTLQEKANRYEESLKTMEKVLEIDPKNADAMNFIGYAYADRGIRLDEAEKMIAAALAIKPDNGYILDSMGWVLFKKNKIEEAIRYLKKALEFLPDDAAIMEHLGDVFLHAGRDKEALEYYHKAVKTEPDNKKIKSKIDALINKK